MKLVKHQAFNISGLMVRTRNTDEMTESTAKIGSLWQRFYQEYENNITAGTNFYGVYTNYESDHNGFYDVIAGTDQTNEHHSASLFNHCTIAPGEYLVFSAQGEMPQTVIALWNEVWQYFERLPCDHQRAYTTDVEYYKNDTEIEIHISIL